LREECINVKYKEMKIVLLQQYYRTWKLWIVLMKVIIQITFLH